MVSGTGGGCEGDAASGSIAELLGGVVGCSLGLRGFVAAGVEETAGWLLLGRGLSEFTARYPELEVLCRLPVGTLVDGELVTFDAQGRPDLPRLLRRHGLTDSWRIRQARRWCAVRYVVL